MEMKNPPHPGLLIHDSLGALGVSTSDAAKALGVSRQQLHKIMAGRSAVTAGMALKLEQAIGSTADTWLRLQGSYDLARARQDEGAPEVRRLVSRVAGHAMDIARTVGPPRPRIGASHAMAMKGKSAAKKQRRSAR